MKHPTGAGDVEEEVVQAGKRRLQGVAEVVEGDVGMGLDEEHSLPGALHVELAAGSFPEAAGQGVVEDEGLGQGAADDLGGVAAGHGGVAAVELDDRDVEAQAFLVVDVGEPLELVGSRLGRTHQHGLAAPDAEPRCHCVALRCVARALYIYLRTYVRTHAELI